MKFSQRKFVNHVFFCILLLTYLAVTFFLFYRQCINYNGGYRSDMPAYIQEIQGIDSGYDFPYPILFFTGQFFLLFTTPQYAMAIASMLLNGLTAIMLKHYFDKALSKEWLSSLLTFSLLFASMLYPLTYLGRYNPLGEDYLYRYFGTFTPNPYHNATYLAARPFTIPVFFLFADILDFYEKENKWFHPKYLFMGLFLLFATMTKPSFTLIFVATAGLIMLFRLIRSRFRGTKAFFQCGIWFIPTFGALLYQYAGVFQPQAEETEKGIGFRLFAAWWPTVCDNIPGVILLATAFPLSVLLFCVIHKKIPKILQFTWQFFLIAMATLACLYEKGPRLADVNFAWGYMHGLFFLYVVSLMIVARYTLQHKQPVWQLTIQWLVYGLHLICGLDYFRVLLQGGMFL